MGVVPLVGGDYSVPKDKTQLTGHVKDYTQSPLRSCMARFDRQKANLDHQ